MIETSEVCLEVRLPPPGLDLIHYSVGRGADGQARSERGVPYGVLGDHLRAEAVCEAVVQNWATRAEYIVRVGNELCRWLLDDTARAYLASRVGQWVPGEPRLRIEIHYPVASRWRDFPWEMCCAGNLGFLSTHPALTLMRRPTVEFGQQAALQRMQPLRIELVAPTPRPTASYAELRNNRELLAIQKALSGARGPAAVRLEHEVDLEGLWDRLHERYQQSGPPAVFHFAGHGMADGGGLVFKSTDGEPREIASMLVASVLAQPPRPSVLCFLNACYSASGRPERFQPFGGLSDLLLQRGVSFVAGAHTSLFDETATILARTFYGALAAGSAVDCAMQRARKDLFERDEEQVDWAFVSLSGTREPEPLVERFATATPPTADIFAFGHSGARQMLELHMKRTTPLVVMIHGERGRAHEHVMRRFQHDLLRSGRVIWQPVNELAISSSQDKDLRRQQFLAAMAHALGYDDAGTAEEVETRLAGAILARCGPRVLILSVEEPLSVDSETRAGALVELIQENIPALLTRCLERKRDLPLLFLLGVQYEPKRLMSKDWGREAIKRLQKLSQAGTRATGSALEVLDELQQFTVDEVERFVRTVLSKEKAEARSEALRIVYGSSEKDASPALDFMRRALGQVAKPDTNREILRQLERRLRNHARGAQLQGQVP